MALMCNVVKVNVYSIPRLLLFHGVASGHGIVTHLNDTCSCLTLLQLDYLFSYAYNLMQSLKALHTYYTDVHYVCLINL